MALGSLEEAFLLGTGVWKAMGVLDECCLVTEAAKRCWLRNWSIFSYHPLGVVGITSIHRSGLRARLVSQHGGSG